jgi:hypothetical protein
MTTTKLLINIAPRWQGSSDLVLPDFNQMPKGAFYNVQATIDGKKYNNVPGRLWQDALDQDGNLLINTDGFKENFVGWWLQKYVIDQYQDNCIPLPEASPIEKFNGHPIFQAEVEVQVDYSGCTNIVHEGL